MLEIKRTLDIPDLLGYSELAVACWKKQPDVRQAKG